MLPEELEWADISHPGSCESWTWPLLRMGTDTRLEEETEGAKLGGEAGLGGKAGLSGDRRTAGSTKG